MTLKNGFGCWFPNRFENNLAPEEGFSIPWRKVEHGLFSNRNIGHLFKYIYFCFILSSTSWSGLAVRMSCRFIFFYKFNCTDLGLQLGDPAPLIGLLLWTCWYFIYFGTYPGGKGNRLNRCGSERRSKPSIQRRVLFNWNPRKSIRSIAWSPIQIHYVHLRILTRWDTYAF